MENIAFQGSKLEFMLEAQSPLIHFQWKETGVTLRASEVKPKLDRFLLKKMGIIQDEEASYSESKIKELYKENKGIFINEQSLALNYKMKIVCLESEKRPIDLDAYKIYFGNQGKDCENKIKGIQANVKISILCFSSTLREKIENNIEEFFIVTNFGTMQGKGFGSFIVKSGLINKTDITKIKEILEKYYASRICHSYLKTNTENQFKFIKKFYSGMKSGTNGSGFLIKRYDKNDKVIASDFHKRKGTTYLKLQEYNYVRIVLGMAEYLTYKDVDDVILIEHKDKSIERVSSPIFFKIIGNYVFVTYRKIPQEIFNKEFEFTLKEKNRSFVISSPKKFDLDTFFKDYTEFFAKNEKQKNNGRKYN